MPGYQVATLNVRLKNLIEGLEAQLTIDNLTDARYYTAGVRSESTVYLPRVPQDGRRVMLGLNWHPSW
jgi:outer membrane receptor protein involved in Fe transport